MKNPHANQNSAEGSFVGCESICIALTQLSNKFYIKSGDEVGAIDIVCLKEPPEVLFEERVQKLIYNTL